jgi:hypothetical protein
VAAPALKQSRRSIEMTRRSGFFSVVIGSLLGGLAIHGAFVACSGPGNAGAQTANNCQQWAVIDISPNNLPNTGPTFQSTAGAIPSYVIPAGWEVISAGATSGYLFRKCIQ